MKEVRGRRGQMGVSFPSVLLASLVWDDVVQAVGQSPGEAGGFWNAGTSQLGRCGEASSSEHLSPTLEG